MRSLILLLVLAAVTAACSSDPAPAPEPPSVDQPEVDSEQPATDGPDHPVTDGGLGTDIEAYPTFGFVHAVDASEFPVRVTIDDAELLTGAEAEAAWIDDHGALPEGGIPNDYYIRNTNEGLAEYTTVGNVVIIVSEPSGAETAISAEEWEARVTEQVSRPTPFYEPYHVVFDGHEIVEIRMQYLP